MTKIRLFTTIFVLLFATMFANAQNKTETISVSGNCGMCKTNIEKAAKKAGVADADWNKETKILTVAYDPAATDAAKIQQSVADAGYDTRDIRGSDEAYKKLSPCCKYERTKTYEIKSEKSKGGDDKNCCEKGAKQCCN
jgi:copper chaperone CopZ